MLQDFETHIDTQAGAPRLKQLRAQMKKLGIDAFLIPREDAFMGEYVPLGGERLKWLTGFGGSAGVAVVLSKKAGLFVDGRYVLQAPQQVDTACFDIVPIAKKLMKDWLKENLSDGAIIGFDPFLHTIKQYQTLAQSLKPHDIKLKPLAQNPLDIIWHDQPELPNLPVIAHPDELAGKSSLTKRTEIAKQLRDKKCDAFMLTQPESIAWLLNIRGDDVPHTPFALSYALLHKTGGVDWFIEPQRVRDEIIAHIRGRGGSGKGAKNTINLIAPDKMPAHLKNYKNASIGLDFNNANYAFSTYLPKAIKMTDPCSLPKACKTDAEISGAVEAHKRDGAALCKFLCWLDTNAPKGKETEISAAKKLEAFRVETGLLLDLSFDTISGSGAHGAIVHYRVTQATNRPLKRGDLYLVDSGGQYRDGTTDVTRTILIEGAAAPKDAIMAFTRVLKGHIALGAARFPKGTNGVALDALARAPLWAVGLDFDHGTGHGVGSYLSVHEGPQSISRLGIVAMDAGMIVSNEPGYYREGSFGIRIENLQYVTPLSTSLSKPAGEKSAGAKSAGEKPAGEKKGFHGFTPLTLAPIDRRLIDAKLMTRDELDWLNDYHQQVQDILTPLVDDTTKNWLAQACAPLIS